MTFQSSLFCCFVPGLRIVCVSDGTDEGGGGVQSLPPITYTWPAGEMARSIPQGGVPCAVRALCEKLAVLHHREFGKFRRLEGCH